MNQEKSLHVDVAAVSKPPGQSKETRAFQNQGSLLTPEPHAALGAQFPSPHIPPKALKKGVHAPEYMAEQAATIIKKKNHRREHPKI